MKCRKQKRENNYLYMNIPSYIFPKPQIKSSKNVSESISTIPKDINLNDIFNEMSNTSNEFYKNNNNLFIKLSQEEIYKRKIILESIKLFIIQNKIRFKLFYSIIFLFDCLYAKNEKYNMLNSIERLGLGAVILTLKYNYEESRMITNKKYKNIFKNKYFSSKDINEIEILCLKLINYNLNFPSPITFMEIMLLNRIISYQDDIKKGTRKRIYNLIINILEKILCQSNEYIKYNPLNLCCCIIYYTREILGLEKWTRILSNLFQSNFQSFELIYNEYFKINKNNNNTNNIYDSSNNNSTNVDSHGNPSNSRNKTDDNTNNNSRNNYYKENENYRSKILTKKFNINIEPKNINNNISSEKKTKRYNNSVDILSNKKEKEKYSYQKELIKGRNILYKTKSNLENLFNDISINKLNKEIINKNNNLMIYLNASKYNNIRPIHMKENLIKNEIEKESNKNIKIYLKPFPKRQNNIQTNKNLGIFINTECNNNSLFYNKKNKINENKNTVLSNKKENKITRNINISSNNINSGVKDKRNSSFEFKKEDKINFMNNAIFEKPKGNNTNFSLIKNNHYLKKLNETIFNENKENNEDSMKNSFFYKWDINNNLKKEKQNKNRQIAKSIETIPKNHIQIYNIKKYNNINSTILENEKNEEQNGVNPLKNSKISSNKKNKKFSLEIFYENKKSSEIVEHNKNSEEINKKSHIRNFYKQKNSSVNRVFNKK